MDREHRSLEYTIYDKELNDIRQKLDDLEREQVEQAGSSTQAYQSTQELQNRLQKLENEVQSIQSQLQVANSSLEFDRNHHDVVQILKNEKRGIDEDRQGLLKARAKLELELTDLQSIVNQATSNQSNAQGKLKSLVQEIEAKEAELATVVRPQFEEVRFDTELLLWLLIFRVHRRCRRKPMPRRSSRISSVVAGSMLWLLQLCDSCQCSELYSKQSRGKLFKNKSERDAWLNKEIQSLSQVQDSVLRSWRICHDVHSGDQLPAEAGHRP